MQAFKRQVDRESRWSSNCSHGSPDGNGVQAFGRNSHQMIETVMQSASMGKVIEFTLREVWIVENDSSYYPFYSVKCFCKYANIF